MTVARTVADVLAEHVVFEVECIDRMYLNVYQPRLQYAAGLVGYVHRQLGLPIASTAPLAKITDRFTRAVHRFAADRGHPVGGLHQGAAQGRRHARAPAALHRGAGGGVHRPGAGEDHGVPHRETPPPGRGRLSVDREVHRDGQPVLLLLRRRRFRAVLPQVLLLLPVQRASCASTATTGRNGRPRRPGSGSPRWTTRSPTSTTPPRCRPSATGSDRRRSRRWPTSGWRSCRTRSPTPTGTPGTGIELSILQAEFSLTQMLDNPVSGRVFFEQVIRDNLDIGRPDQVSLIFDRRL